MPSDFEPGKQVMSDRFRRQRAQVSNQKGDKLGGSQVRNRMLFSAVQIFVLLLDLNLFHRVTSDELEALAHDLKFFFVHVRRQRNAVRPNRAYH